MPQDIELSRTNLGGVLFEGSSQLFGEGCWRAFAPRFFLASEGSRSVLHLGIFSKFTTFDNRGNRRFQAWRVAWPSASAPSRRRTASRLGFPVSVGVGWVGWGGAVSTPGRRGSPDRTEPWTQCSWFLRFLWSFYSARASAKLAAPSCPTPPWIVLVSVSDISD